MTILAYVTNTQSNENHPFDIAEKHNVEHWFTDDAFSESIRIVERPGFIELLKFVRKGDTVVVYSIQSLGKCSFELYDAFKALRAKGVNVVSLREDFDLSSTTGTTFLKTLTTLKELHRTITRHQSREGK